MKMLLSLVLCILSLIAFASLVFAAEQSNIVYTQVTVLENDFTIVKEIIGFRNARSTYKSYDHRIAHKNGNTIIDIIVIATTFR